MIHKPVAAGLLLLLAGGAAMAQSGANWSVEDHSFNSGGTPVEGDTPLSPSGWELTLASIGDATRPVTAAGLSYSVTVGFGSAFEVPGEVMNLVFTTAQTISWDADSSADQYNLYRDDTSDGYGNCEEQGLLAVTTTDASAPTPGNTFHYLVTASNRVAQEGTKGFQTDMTERLGSFGLPGCP